MYKTTQKRMEFKIFIKLKGIPIIRDAFQLKKIRIIRIIRVIRVQTLLKNYHKIPIQRL